MLVFPEGYVGVKLKKHLLSAHLMKQLPQSLIYVLQEGVMNTYE